MASHLYGASGVRLSSRPGACCGALLAVVWSIYWWLAVPRHEICAMTLPAPPGCNSGRVPVAAFWTAATACVFLAMAFLEAKAT